MTYDELTAEERYEKIRTMLFEDGLSYRAIGAHLGVSRNTIAGFCHRHNLKLGITTSERAVRANAARYRGVVRSTVTKKQPDIQIKINKKSVPLPTTADTWAALPGTLPVKLTSIGTAYHQCRWPIGEHTHTVCGQPTEAGSPYCVTHSELAFRSEAKSEKKNFIRNLKATRSTSWARVTTR